MSDPDRTIRISKLSDQGTERDLADTTPAERIGMMWQLALDAWALKGETVSDSRVERHIQRIIRLQDDVNSM